MRTTLTLEDAVADGLKQLQHAHPDKSFKQLVNELLKQGLQVAGVHRPPAEKFVIEPAAHAIHRAEFNFDNIGKLIETVEGDAHR